VWTRRRASATRFLTCPRLTVLWTRSARVVVVAAVTALAVLAPIKAWAQAGWYVEPSISLTEEFDDNLFGRASGKQSDYITRLTLGFGAGYRSAPLSVFGTYSAGAEWYAETSELNGVLNRQQAGLDLAYLPTQALTLRLTGSFGRTETSTVSLQPVLVSGGSAGATAGGGSPAGSAAGDTATSPATAEGGTTSIGTPPPGVPAVEVGPRRSTVVGISTSAAYAATPRLSLETGYAFARTSTSAGPVSPTPVAETTDFEHEARVGLRYQVTPLDRGSFLYRVRIFDGDQAASTTSHIVTVGWDRRLGEATTASLEVGPRFSEGDTEVEAAARLEHRFRLVTVGLAYARSEGLVVGRSGPQTTDTGSATVTYEPLRTLQLSIGGSVIRADNASTAAPGASSTAGSGSSEQITYRIGAGAFYRLTEWLTAQLAYSFSLQEEAGQTIRHHIVSLSLVVSYPYRVY
jgi:hypothetical protein